MANPSFSGGILNIPGLMPVNIGSSNAYPVPFDMGRYTPPQGTPLAPQTQTAGMPQTGQPTPQQAPQQAPAPVYQGPGGGAPSPVIGGNITDGYTPTFGGAGDAQFASLPGYGGSDGFGAYQNYAPYINPGQGYDAFGSFGSGLGNFGSDVGSKLGTGLDNYGQGLWDRISSIGDMPSFNSDNLAQAGINAAGMFSPIAPALAGVLQGFNILDPGETTGNALADVAGTPGGIQSLVADGTNWINRQFGGTYMPSSYIPPNMDGPPTADGSPYAGGPGGYVAPNFSGPSNSQYSGTASDPYQGWDPATLYSLTGLSLADLAKLPVIPPPDISHMTLGEIGGSGNNTPDGLPADPFSLQGNLMNTFMLGATFGGAGYGYGSPNWMAPGPGAVDHYANPYDTN